MKGGDEKTDLEVRAADLIRQMGQEPAADPKTGICAAELAGTVLRRLMLPDIAALRQRLVVELPLFGSEVRDGQDILLSGQADAVAFDETGAIDVVVDWKSDVSPEPSSIGHYRQSATTAGRLTTGQVVDVA